MAARGSVLVCNVLPSLYEIEEVLHPHLQLGEGDAGGGGTGEVEAPMHGQERRVVDLPKKERCRKRNYSKKRVTKFRKQEMSRGRN